VKITVRKNGVPVRHWSAQRADDDAFLWVFGFFSLVAVSAVGLVVWAVVSIVNWLVTK